MRSPGEWLDAWIDLTTWWVEPARSAAQSLPAQADQVLAQLIEGLTTRFGGGRIDVTVRGRRVRAALDGLRLLRRTAGRELRIDLSDGHLDDLPFGHLALVAQSVRIEAGLEPALVVHDIDIEGRAPLQPVIEWLGGYVDGWVLDLRAGEVVARSERAEVAFVVEPSVADGVLRLDIRALHWRRVRLGIPRWLRFERTVPIALHPSWSLLEASRAADVVRFRVRGADVEHRLSARSLRDAVMHGGRIRLADEPPS
jgi:hypothetical protein